jgi:hypothetical protein
VHLYLFITLPTRFFGGSADNQYSKKVRFGCEKYRENVGESGEQNDGGRALTKTPALRIWRVMMQGGLIAYT